MMVRLLPRRQSLLSLFVGVVFGCCIISLINQSHQLFYQNHFILADDRKIQANENETNWHQDPILVVPKEKGEDLYDKVRVLCWILTTPENHETRAKAVKETWGKRCNILLFMSSANDLTLPSVELAVREGRNGLWGKTREAFRYAWDRYQDEVDWFLKADDDTYVIVENLRYFLSAFNTSKPLWFGHKFKAIVKSGYFSGGAGYVLSREATRRFVKEGYFNALLCRHDHEGAEDAEMGKCMEKLNVSTMDSRDSKGRGRFHPFVPNSVYFPGNITESYWYWKNIYYPPTKERDCCSDSTISFHYVDTKMMYLLDLFLYQIRPFGMVEQRPATPEPPPDLELTASPWFVPNETTIASTTSTSTTTTASNMTEARHSQQTHQQLLDYLLSQLRPYGIVDPNESTTTTTPGPMVITGIVDAQQLEYLRQYVLDQLQPFGIVDPNEVAMVSSTTPSIPVVANTMDHLPNMDAKTLLMQMMRSLENIQKDANSIPV